MRELDWAAGLFEGEGCVSMSPPRKPTHTPQASVSLVMTDEDTVRRFQRAVGIGSVTGPHERGFKPTWRWSTSGFQMTQAVVAILWQGLGTRRRARATEVLVECRGVGQKAAAAERERRKHFVPNFDSHLPCGVRN